MMAKGKRSGLEDIWGDEPAAVAEPAQTAPAPELAPSGEPARAPTSMPAARARSRGKVADPQRRNHGDKKPVLIHIPEDMHRLLRRISVEEGEPLTAITERMLRQYLVTKGHTKFAA